MIRGLRAVATAVAGLALGTMVSGTTPAFAQAADKYKIGIVTFLSGPGAPPFGIPARNSAELIADAINKGEVPAPYNTKGIGGRQVELVIVDENGPTAEKVTDYRNLVQRDKVDFVIGYISSGNCLAVAPVAEELKAITLFFDCGTPRIFEDGNYQYVFRTSPTATMDNVGAALCVRDVKPNLKSIAGINQNYAWGQDSWADFEASIKQFFPKVQVKTSQMPKLFAGQYNTEISTLLGEKADVIHSSFFDGDLEALLLQGAPRNLFKTSMGVLTTGETAMHKLPAQIPDGTLLGARGPFGPYAPKSALNTWFVKEFEAKNKVTPNSASYQMAQAILGIKVAWEKAQAAIAGKRPSNNQVAAAFEYIRFEGPGGQVDMANGKGHQAIMETAYGTTKLVNGKITLTNVKRYPAEKVNPPEGVKAADWIKRGFK